jgi:hypothetical protein
MTVERNQIGWAIWLVWVLMTTMGYVLGWFIGFFLAQVPEEFIGSSALEDILAYFIAGAVLGFGVGLMQWLLLRGYVSRAGWWVLASTVGWGLSMMAVVEAFDVGLGFPVSGAMLGAVTGGALGGAVTGILQWLVLRGQVSRAGWWVLASTVGWGLSMAVVEAFDVGLGLPVGGVVLGAVTGGAIVWLLRQPVPEA